MSRGKRSIRSTASRENHHCKSRASSADGDRRDSQDQLVEGRLRDPIEDNQYTKDSHFLDRIRTKP